MKYDFETLVNRAELGSSKWNNMYETNPNVSKDVVPLSVADMEFKNPPEIMEGLKKCLDETILGYTIPTQKYFDAVKSWMKKRHNWDITEDSIVCTPGVVTALFIGVCAFTEPGDKIMLLTPVYYPFYIAVEGHGRQIVNSSLLEKDGKYEMDFEDIEEKIVSNDVKLLLLCNPHNPVGRVWTKDELKKLGDICKKHNVFVISDEIHNDLIMPGNEHTVFHNVDESFKDFSMVCTAPSKTFNLAGMQVSNIIITNEELRNKFRMALFVNAAAGFLGTLAYEACTVAYNECEEWLEELIQVIHKNSKVVEEFMAEKMPKVKVSKLEGTYLQWLDFKEVCDDYKKLEEININKAEVFFDEGHIFGVEGQGFERINLACPTRVIEETLERLYKTYKELELV